MKEKKARLSSNKQNEDVESETPQRAETTSTAPLEETENTREDNLYKFSDPVTRYSFYRKVSVTLLFEFLIVCVTAFIMWKYVSPDGKKQWIGIAVGFIVGVVLIFLATYSKHFLRIIPMNLIFLVAIECCEATLMACLTLKLSSIEALNGLHYYVMAEMAFLGAMLLGFVILSFQTICNGRIYHGLLIIIWMSTIGCIVYGVALIWHFPFLSFLYIMVYVVSTTLVAFYIMYGLERIVQGRNDKNLGPKDFAAAGLLLYPNIINIIYKILMFIGVAIGYIFN